MTRLVASMMVGPGEASRYLPVTVPALLEFCDLVAIRYEDEPEYEYLRGWDDDRVKLLYADAPFFVHEGRARQDLLEWTLALEPSHVLAVDADEIVTDGQQLRQACETSCPILALRLEEVWRADAEALHIRVDGGWRPHDAPVCFQVPAERDETWRINDRQLACGREPVAVREWYRQNCWEPSGVSLLHLGWANEGERAARHERYVVADGGRFHAGSHLASIMWADERVSTMWREWPDGIAEYKRALLERINREEE